MFKLKNVLRLISIIGISFLISCDSNPTSSEKAKLPALSVGAVMPEIKLESIQNSDISLSSLHGSVVLVDFWASWCAPCRKENKFLLKLYNKYKDVKFKGGQGFKIYSISLDGSGDISRNSHHKMLWKKAIKEDGLIWPYQVSDLKGWTSPLIDQFKIEAIPASFLIDSKGNILAKDLRGEELESFLINQLDI